MFNVIDKKSRVDISGRGEKYFQTYDTGESTAICVRHAKYDGKTHLEVVPICKNN